MGHFQWTPNFYIIFVAPPGIVSKSTTLAVGMKLLRKVKDVHFGPDAVTWQALTQALAGSRLDYNIGGLLYPMSCITIAASEFGTFLNPHDREMIDVLVDLWDGRLGPWEKRTKTSGSDLVVNPWINIAACTTPAWIAGNFPDYLIGGGFTSRCVFVFAEKKRRLIPYPILEIQQPDEFQEMEKVLISDLQDIGRMGGPFKISEAAFEFGCEWYRKHYENLSVELNNAQFAGYLARKQTHFHKLAMVLAASESSELVIKRHHLEQAEAIITSLEADMPRVFAHIGQQGGAKHTTELLDIIRAYGTIGKRDLFRLAASHMSVTEFNEAIEGVVFTGYVLVEQRGAMMFYTYVKERSTKTAG